MVQAPPRCLQGLELLVVQDQVDLLGELGVDGGDHRLDAGVGVVADRGAVHQGLLGQRAHGALDRGPLEIAARTEFLGDAPQLDHLAIGGAHDGFDGSRRDVVGRRGGVRGEVRGELGHGGRKGGGEWRRAWQRGRTRRARSAERPQGRGGPSARGASEPGASGRGTSEASDAPAAASGGGSWASARSISGSRRSWRTSSSAPDLPSM